MGNDVLLAGRFGQTAHCLSRIMRERPFEDREIVAVLSYIKSTWPADIAEIHDKINADYKSNRAMREKMGGS